MAHTSQGGEQVRCDEERDLIQRWNPSLNVHLPQGFLTLGFSSDRNYVLKGGGRTGNARHHRYDQHRSRFYNVGIHHDRPEIPTLANWERSIRIS